MSDDRQPEDRWWMLVSAGFVAGLAVATFWMMVRDLAAP